MNEGFPGRLSAAFENQTMAQIARRIGVPHATVRNYFQGRLPSPEVLIKIASATQISLNWLLMGEGEMFTEVGARRDIGRLIEDRIGEIVVQKLAERRTGTVQELGTVDAAPPFDVEASLARSGDPHKVMSEWFRHEKRRYPKDFGVDFFRGWEAFTDQERVDAIRDAKKVLDRTLKKK
jgi:transcriptional regulator with XRE-family HTH domain